MGDGEVHTRRASRMLFACAVVMVVLSLPGSAFARPVSANKDGRPNILVIMTDDQALPDVTKMPNVQRLIAAQGTTFADAVDSFPLCCPSRATFITGQYAHNHGVVGNFDPYGWYGMKHRENILPVWLQRVGYHTALIGKWLNGYGALDGHGEVPAGFDIWRGLLDVSAYDYFNFEMNLNDRLQTWGDASFARKLVAFANIEVTPNPAGLAGVLAKLAAVMGPAPYTYWGTQNPSDYSPDVTGKITEGLVAAEKRSKKPFFILVGARGPTPRGCGHDADGQALQMTRARRRGTRAGARGSPSRDRRASTRSTSPTSRRTSAGTRRCSRPLAFISSRSTMRGGSARCSPSMTM